MHLELEDLPPALRAQAEKQLGIHAAPAPKPAKRKNKYNAEKTPVLMPNGSLHVFDSKHEAQRFQELQLMERAGSIQDLQLQRTFTLQEAYITGQGDPVAAITYKADFVYRQSGEMVVEDAKSEATRKDKTYKLKKKLMAAQGLRIVEV